MTEGASFQPVRYLRRITLAGMLCMIYVPCVSSPVTTDFFRSLGATEFHFGLLSGLPLTCIVFQFLGAHLSNRLRRRRTWFISLTIAGRLLYVPVALLPLVPGIPRNVLVGAQIGLIALGSALQTVTYPMWMSWMGDLIPRRILSRYWASRQRYLTLTMMVVSLTITVVTLWLHGLSVQTLFAVLALIGCTAGTIDLLLFLDIREPPNAVTTEHPWDTLREPLQDRNYRKLVRFLCVWNVASTCAAVFMQIYTLQVLRVPLWLTALVWCAPSLGIALISPLWGRLNDRFGSRPVLRVCVALKPLIVLVFLLVTPELAVPVLAVALFLDSLLNAGIELSTNSYMLRMAPRENRPMFIAMTSGLAGLSAGVSAILAGVFLRETSGFTLELAGREWNHYQLIFLISFLLRLPCIALAGRIREPDSARSRVVLEYLMGLWPMRAFLLPVDLYRRLAGTVGGAAAKAGSPGGDADGQNDGTAGPPRAE